MLIILLFSVVRKSHVVQMSIYTYFCRNVTILSSSMHGNGDVMIGDLNCTGFESHITACQFRDWGHSDCQNGGASAISCGNFFL